MAPSPGAERSRADPARPREPVPAAPAKERCLPCTPPAPTPVRGSGSPPPRPHPAAARESAPRLAAARSADTGSLPLFHYAAVGESLPQKLPSALALANEAGEL